MTGKRRFKVWEGVYGSFADAQGDIGVFDSGVWLDKVKDRARMELAASQSAAAIAPVAETRDYALPYVAALAARPGAKLRVLDFGGGLASSFIPLVKMLPANQELEFVIIENEGVCKAGRELFANEGRISFRSEIPKATERFDIVHCGSSIHYVDDWVGVLEQFSATRPQYMLFVDLPAADNKSFVTAQQYYGSRIPVRFWNLNEFTSQVCRFGYDLVLQSRYSGTYLDRIEMPVTFPESECDVGYFSQVIFRRHSNS